MDLGLKGKVAFVTGGSKGLGNVIARTLAQEGADLALVSRSFDALQRAAEQLSNETGSKVVPVAADLTNAADVEKAVDTVLEKFGRIDVLVNVAGNAPPGDILELTEEDWDTAFELKFRGYMRCMKAVLPHMVERRSGSIVCVIGNDGVKPIYHELPGTAVNAADTAVVIALAEQFGPNGVRINAINPGPMPTQRWDWLEQHMADYLGVSRQEARERTLASLALRRLPELQEVANVVAFLASERASYVTGAIVNVDGHQQKAILHA